MTKNFWNNRYSDTAEFYYGTQPNEFLKSNTHVIFPGGNVLSLGEGEGRNAVFLAKLGFKVTAVDGSSVGMEKMEILAKGKQVSVAPVVSDLNEYKITPNGWDAIVSIWCHIPKILRKNLYAAVAKGLRPGGVFILEAYHPRQLEFKTGGPSDIDLLVRLEDLHEDLAGLNFIWEKELVRDISEGKGHVGLSSVVQVICKKNS